MNSYSLFIQEDNVSVNSMVDGEFNCNTMQYHERVDLPYYTTTMLALQASVQQQSSLQFYVLNSLTALQRYFKAWHSNYDHFKAWPCGIVFNFEDKYSCTAVVCGKGKRQLYDLGLLTATAECSKDVRKRLPDTIADFVSYLLWDIHEMIAVCQAQERAAMGQCDNSKKE